MKLPCGPSHCVFEKRMKASWKLHRAFIRGTHGSVTPVGAEETVQEYKSMLNYAAGVARQHENAKCEKKRQGEKTFSKHLPLG